MLLSLCCQWQAGVKPGDTTSGAKAETAASIKNPANMCGARNIAVTQATRETSVSGPPWWCLVNVNFFASIAVQDSVALGSVCEMRPLAWPVVY
jgi:hypothetical protein